MLLGKIMMGTYGCVPVYDNFDQTTLQQLGYKKHTTINKALPDTYKIIMDNLPSFKKILIDMEQYKNPTTALPINYSVFKILDMILWVEGESASTKKKS